MIRGQQRIRHVPHFTFDMTNRVVLAGSTFVFFRVHSWFNGIVPGYAMSSSRLLQLGQKAGQQTDQRKITAEMEYVFDAGMIGQLAQSS